MHWVYLNGGGGEAAEAENIKHRKRLVIIRAGRKLTRFKNNKPTYGSFPFFKGYQKQRSELGDQHRVGWETQEYNP